MMPYIKILRIKNIVIVALVQSLFYYGIILPRLAKHEITPTLDYNIFPLFILVTVLITSGGNIINDIFDREIDKLNKPKKWYIGNSLSVKNAYLFYMFTVILGFVIALYIAIKISKLPFMALYFLAVYFLYLYSKYLKKTAFWGNILVSAFSAGVMVILLFFEWNTFEKLQYTSRNDYRVIVTVTIGLAIFSFLTSLLRELIKDIEDMEGDKVQGATTIPIIYGIQQSKIMSYILSFVSLMSLFSWIFLPINTDKLYLKTYILTLLIPFLIYISVLIYKAGEKKDYGNLSSMLKIYMLCGILILFFYI